MTRYTLSKNPIAFQVMETLLKDIEKFTIPFGKIKDKKIEYIVIKTTLGEDINETHEKYMWIRAPWIISKEAFLQIPKYNRENVKKNAAKYLLYSEYEIMGREVYKDYEIFKDTPSIKFLTNIVGEINWRKNNYPRVHLLPVYSNTPVTVFYKKDAEDYSRLNRLETRLNKCDEKSESI